jgi:hypothetical protein
MPGQHGSLVAVVAVVGGQQPGLLQRVDDVHPVSVAHRVDGTVQEWMVVCMGQRVDLACQRGSSLGVVQVQRLEAVKQAVEET